jgi:hypothetical protein
VSTALRNKTLPPKTSPKPLSNKTRQGYPDNDFRKLGPKPSTFAGERALDFVLANRGMIDKTLLFDIELMRVQ